MGPSAVRIVAGLGLLLIIGKACEPSASNTTAGSAPIQQIAAAPLEAPYQRAARLKQERRTRLLAMPRDKAREEMADMLLAICSTQQAHLNHIERTVRRVGKGSAGIYCTHEFFTEYSFSAGRLAPEVQDFVVEWRSELLELRISRVGVWGRGSYASGVWYDVK